MAMMSLSKQDGKTIPKPRWIQEPSQPKSLQHAGAIMENLLHVQEVTSSSMESPWFICSLPGNLIESCWWES